MVIAFGTLSYVVIQLHIVSVVFYDGIAGSFRVLL